MSHYMCVLLQQMCPLSVCILCIDRHILATFFFYFLSMLLDSNWIVSRLKWEAAGASAQSSWLGYVAKAFLRTVKKLGDEYIPGLHEQRNWLKQPAMFWFLRKNDGSEWLA